MTLLADPPTNSSTKGHEDHEKYQEDKKNRWFNLAKKNTHSGIPSCFPPLYLFTS
jgi:hypothetical protein